MTIEEKREAIRKVCAETFTDLCCSTKDHGQCPLFTPGELTWCWSKRASDEQILRNYDILVKSGHIVEPNQGKADNVDHPSHYNSGKIECIDAMVESQGVEATKHFCICNAFKYIWRADKKNGLEDIDKAIWYLNKYKELSDGK